MLDNNTISVIQMANKNYEAALKSRVGIADKKQVLSNILISHVGEIIETALDAEYLMKKSNEDKKKIAQLEAKNKKQNEDTPE